MNDVRKLTRPREGRKIAGVCLGLAKYFGVDPTIVRLLAIIALILGCSLGFWAYIIGWVLIPEE